jgi:hypothetical protein
MQQSRKIVAFAGRLFYLRLGRNHQLEVVHQSWKSQGSRTLGARNCCGESPVGFGDRSRPCEGHSRGDL